MAFKDEITRLAHNAGGSFKTREARRLAASRFARFLQAANIQVREVAHIKGRHITAFVENRLAAGIGSRTIQNELSALRSVLRLSGRAKLADQIDNRSLGVASASRDGTKIAISERRFLSLHAQVARRDAGVAAVVQLQRALGLRAEEAVKACKSLSTWERQILADLPIRVVFGTKGGRPRDVRAADTARAQAAIANALAIIGKNRGVLISKPNEKEAMTRYRNVMTAAGFVGKESGHSLRYAFAQEQIRNYLRQGYNHKESLALTSMDLGHGDGRGRYIAQVYSRTDLA